MMFDNQLTAFIFFVIMLSVFVGLVLKIRPVLNLFFEDAESVGDEDARNMANALFKMPTILIDGRRVPQASGISISYRQARNNSHLWRN